jgi:hypothetical protein
MGNCSTSIFSGLIAAAKQSGSDVVPRDIPLPVDGKSYMLRSRQSFKVAYPERRSVWVCDLIRLDDDTEIDTVIVKTFEPLPDAKAAPRELRFYESLRGLIEVDGLRIPKLFGAHGGADGMAQLFLEYFDRLSPISSARDINRRAFVLGRMAGHCHAAKLHAEAWLPQNSLIPQVQQMTAFDQLLEALPLSADEKSEVFESYLQFLTRLADLNAEYAGQLATLCHGDIGPRNLQVHGECLTALDWEAVGVGRMGDDLAQFAARMLREADPQSPESVQLIADYVAGASPYVSHDPTDSIRRVFHARLIVEKLGQVNAHMRRIHKAQNGAAGRHRLRKLAGLYRRVALRAREAVRDLSGIATIALGAALT